MKQVTLLSIILAFLSCFINDKEVLALESMNTSITPRVMMGHDANIQDFGYVASLRVGLRYFCVAICIGDADVTAPASCFTHTKEVMWPYFDVSIHTGTTNIDQAGTTHRIKKVTVHPGWTGIGAWRHDIAHIKVDGGIQLGHFTRKIFLPRHDFPSYTKAVVSGWGRTEQDGPTLWQDLKFTEMWTLNYLDCEKFLPLEVLLNKEQLCTYQLAGFGCTEYDRGAPLVVGHDLIGFHSWFPGHICASGQPEIYTDVFAERAFLLHFIHAT